MKKKYNSSDKKYKKNSLVTTDISQLDVVTISMPLDKALKESKKRSKKLRSEIIQRARRARHPNDVVYTVYNVGGRSQDITAADVIKRRVNWYPIRLKN